MSSVPPRPSRLAACIGLLLGLNAPWAAADEAATGAPPATAAPARSPVFDVLEFVVDGNTVLDQETVERAVYPFLGPAHGMQDIEGARAALESAFQKSGYLTVSVDIPEQKIENGVVRLRIIEGRVGRLRVVGSRYFDQGYIRAHAPALTEGSVPSFPDIQKELATLNTTPDRRVTPTLRPGRDPGTVDVDLNVEDHVPVHGNVELDDRYNAFTKPLRLTGSFRYDNLWQLDHSLGITWNVAPQEARDSNVVSATYLMPLGDGHSLAMYLVHSRSDVVPGAFDTIGKGNIEGVRYVIPLPGDKELFHTFTIGIDHKQFAQDVALIGADTSRTPIVYTPFQLQYAGFATGGGGTTQFMVSANLDLSSTLGNSDAEFFNKRYGASASYLMLRTDVSRTQSLWSDWSLFARVNAQFSPDPLISNEQLALGGQDTVRGYFESEALGDSGVNTTLELRTPHLAASRKDTFPEFYTFVFLDDGNLKDHQALPNSTFNYSLASEGLGLKLSSRAGFHLGLDWAHVLRTSTYTHEGASRLEFRLSQDY